MRDRLKRAGDALTGIGARMAAIGTLGIAPLAMRFASFDDAMRMVKATAEATDAQFKQMSDTAKELGRTTSFTAVQVANLMVELARAGFTDPTDLENVTKAALDLSRATGTEATLSAEILATAIKTFKLEATDAVHVADLLTATANKTLTEVKELGFAFAYAAPDAKRLGMSVKDTLTLLGGLADFGIRGEMAGTALRRMMTLTAAGSKDLQRIFGVEGLKPGRQLIDVLDDISTSLQGLSITEQSEKLYEFFGILGITGVSGLGGSVKSVRQLGAELDNVGGISRRTAKDMDAGLGGAIRFTLRSIEGTAIALGESLAPALMKVGDFLKQASTAATEWINENKTAATVIASLAVALPIAGVALLSFGLTLKLAAIPLGMLAGAVGLLGTALGVLISPLGVAVAAIGGMVLALTSSEDDLIALGRRAGDVAGSVANSVAAAAGSVWDRFMAARRAGWEEFKGTAIAAWEGVVAAFNKGDLTLAFKIIGAGLRLEWQKVIIYWRELFEDFTADFRNMWEDAINYVRVRIPKLVAGTELGLDFIGKAFFGGPGAAVGDIEATLKDIDKRRADAEAIADAARETIRLEEEARKKRHAAEKEAALAPLKAEMELIKEEFKKLIAEAKKGLEVAPAPREVNVAPMPRALGRDLARVAMGIPSVTRGAFAVPNARQMFGMGGDTVQRKQLNAQERIAKATEVAAKNGEKLLLALAFK